MDCLVRRRSATNAEQSANLVPLPVPKKELAQLPLYSRELSGLVVHGCMRLEGGGSQCFERPLVFGTRQ